MQRTEGSHTPVPWNPEARPQGRLTVGVGNILMSVSHGSTYIMEGHMGGGNVLTWEVVSQTLLW